jgi:hypothetical protein
MSETLPTPTSGAAPYSAGVPATGIDSTPVPVAFDLAIARLCAQASAQAYNGATVETSLAHALIGQVTIGGLSFILLVFRGTKSIRDWITDLKFSRRQIVPRFLQTNEVVAVHEGFDEAMTDIYVPVLSYIKTLPSVPVIVGGHSLGGAIAMEFAYRCTSLPIHRVYTFGQPRIGNAGFRADYNRFLGEITFRMVNEEDLVPRLPLWLVGNRHAGREIFFPVGGAPRENAPLWFKLASDAEGFYRAYHSRRLLCVDEELVDHHVDNYVRRLG